MNNITYIFWISVIIFSIGFSYAFIKNDKDKNEKVFDTFCGCGLSLIICFFVFLLVCFISMITSEHIEETYSNKYELRCLKDYSKDYEELEGVFILGSGYISQQTTNEYTIKYASADSKGIYRINTLDGQSANIGFVFDNENCIEIYTKTTYNKNNKLFRWLFNKSPEKQNQEWTNCDYVFHIPEDGMIADKDIDLE